MCLLHAMHALDVMGKSVCSRKDDCPYFCFDYTADIISTVEFNHSGELLATGDKGGRVVIFQQEQEVSSVLCVCIPLSHAVLSKVLV